MKRALSFFLFLLLPLSQAQAWNLRDHRKMGHHALQDVAAEWALDQPIAIHPLSTFLNKLGALRPEITGSVPFSRYLQVDSKVDIGHVDSYLYPEAALKDRTEMTALEILTNYATDPDDGRDQNLFLRDASGRPIPAYEAQKWFGLAQGPNSQAFRHIEKPPFCLAHPIDTFGFPLWKLGEASRRAEIYHQLSLLAFALDEDYWGWRFLGNAFHYLQDLHQPYHAGQIPPSLLKKGLKALAWGWKEKGLIKTFAHIVSNSHRFFESYVDVSDKPLAFKALEGKDWASTPTSFEVLATEVRDASNKIYGRLAKAVSQIADPKLDGPYEFKSDDVAQDDPLKFLNRGPGFDAANQEIFDIVRERFASAGTVMRTAVHRVLEEKKNHPDPKLLLVKLDELLGPSPF